MEDSLLIFCEIWLQSTWYQMAFLRFSLHAFFTTCCCQFWVRFKSSYDIDLLFCLEFNSHRFFHCVKLDSLVSNYGEKPVPPFPEIYEQRVSNVSYFYEGISLAFPINKLTYVYLPPLFLKTQSTKCMDASFEISVVTKGLFLVLFHVRFFIFKLILTIRALSIK
jgi:hypothetical protein